LARLARLAILNVALSRST